jgi:hypothetical protein
MESRMLEDLEEDLRNINEVSKPIFVKSLGPATRTNWTFSMCFHLHVKLASNLIARISLRTDLVSIEHPPIRSDN